MKHRWISITIALALVALALGVLFVSVISAAPEAIIGTITHYPSTLPADTTSTDCSTGTPYAVRVNFPVLSASETYTVKAYHYTTTDTTNRGCFWNFQTNSWVVIDNNYGNLPTVTGVTTWTGWLYIKEVTQHVGKTSTADGLKLRVRFRSSVGTGIDATITTGLVAADMSNSCVSNCGGWLEETDGSARAGRAVAVKSGTTVVGMYVAEDNGINEGYTAMASAASVAAPAAIGYYKVAAPAGSGYTVETWDLAAPGTPMGEINTMGDDGCPSTVTAGAVTSMNTCTAPTAVTLRTLTAAPAPFSPLAALPVLGLVTLAGLTVYRRRRTARP